MSNKQLEYENFTLREENIRLCQENGKLYEENNWLRQCAIDDYCPTYCFQEWIQNFTITMNDLLYITTTDLERTVIKIIENKIEEDGIDNVPMKVTTQNVLQIFVTEWKVCSTEVLCDLIDYIVTEINLLYCNCDWKENTKFVHYKAITTRLNLRVKSNIKNSIRLFLQQCYDGVERN